MNVGIESRISKPSFIQYFQLARATTTHTYVTYVSDQELQRQHSSSIFYWQVLLPNICNICIESRIKKLSFIPYFILARTTTTHILHMN